MYSSTHSIPQSRGWESNFFATQPMVLLASSNNLSNHCILKKLWRRGCPTLSQNFRNLFIMKCLMGVQKLSVVVYYWVTNIRCQNSRKVQFSSFYPIGLLSFGSNFFTERIIMMLSFVNKERCQDLVLLRHGGF